MCCNKVCIHLVIIFAYVYHLIVIKITYSIFLLIFRSANRRSERYVSPYYKKETLVATYSGLLYPVCHPDEWDVPESVRSIVVNPPIWRKQAGRPRSTRIPSAGERGRRRHQVCSNCRQVGHNRINCTNIDDSPVTGASTSAPEPSGEPRRRRPRVCSVCRQPGHTRIRCNLYNVDFEEELNNDSE